VDEHLFERFAAVDALASWQRRCFIASGLLLEEEVCDRALRARLLAALDVIHASLPLLELK
jgi:hypothetical protein